MTVVFGLVLPPLVHDECVGKKKKKERESVASESIFLYDGDTGMMSLSCVPKTTTQIS